MTRKETRQEFGSWHAPWRPPASSWRWPSDEEFTETVDPLHINEVSHVSHAWRIRSWANSLSDFFEALRSFSEACNDAERRLKLGRKELIKMCKPMDETMCDIGHHGEMLLLYQRRLATDDAAQNFIHYKDFIQHAAHELHRESHPLEIERLISAAIEFRTLIYDALRKSDEFVVSGIKEIPRELQADFYQGRDLFSIGFDEAAILLLARGLERVCRRVLAERKVSLKTKKGLSPASDSDLFDVIEVMGRLRWKVGDGRLISQSSQRMLHWLRTIRNEGAHDEMPEATDPYVLGPLIAAAAESIYATHKDGRRRRLASYVIAHT